MKYTAILFLFTFFSYAVKAQDTTANDTLKIRRAQNINLEIGSAGIFYSVNYDIRFSAKRGGLGARLGVGYWHPGSTAFLSIPFQLNYLVGSRRNFLELGAGVTLLNMDDTHTTFFGSTSRLISSQALITSTIGYRFQPIHHGVNFRASLNPLLADGIVGMYFGFGIGYTFR